MKCRAILDRDRYPMVELIAEPFERAEEGAVVAVLNQAAAVALLVELAVASREALLLSRGQATKSRED